MIKIDGNEILIKRTGSVNSSMTYKVDTKKEFLYHLPYGTVPMEIETQRIVSKLDENGGTIELVYTLTVQGEKYITLQFSRINGIFMYRNTRCYKFKFFPVTQHGNSDACIFFADYFVTHFGYAPARNVLAVNLANLVADFKSCFFSLDDYSEFYTPEEYKAFQDKLNQNFYGIGI